MYKETVTYGTRFDCQGDADPLCLIIKKEFPGRIALVSSFGAEAAVLLHRVAQIDRNVSVIFLDTGKMFGETLRYRDELIETLGLTDIRSPKPQNEPSFDPDGTLWMSRPDTCCTFRKVAPLNRALHGFAAWISGRKRIHAGSRSTLPLREVAPDGKVKINPMADWNRADTEAYFAHYELPAHPLVADGYYSIGCMPCTQRSVSHDDPRNVRWVGLGKTECGIHLPLGDSAEGGLRLRLALSHLGDAYRTNL
jgi:phosphoadenosine phosphosulfate reductase